MARSDEIRVKIVGDARDLQQAVDQARNKALGFKGALGEVAKTAGGFLAGQAISKGLSLVQEEFQASVQAASDLEQAVGGTQAIFNDSRHVIDRWARDSADSVGLSEAAFREGTTQIGSVLKRLTGDVNFAANESIKLVQIGADVAATFGGTTQEAVEALAATFRGEADPAERFGFGLNVTAVQAEAAARGMGKVETGTKEYAEVLISMIKEQAEANGAMGQFGREAETAAGQTQRARAELENLRAEAGEAVVPLALLWERAKLVFFRGAGFVVRDPLGIKRLTGNLEGFNERADDTQRVTQAATDRLTGLAQAGVNVRRSQEDAGESVRVTSEELQEEAEAAKEASVSVDDLAKELRALADPQFALVDAQNAFEEAIDNATESLKENGRTLDKHTDAGRKNRASLKDIAESALDLIAAQAGTDASTEKLRKVTQRGRREFIRQAEQMGLTKKEAKELADQYGLVPARVVTVFGTKGIAEAKENVRSLINRLEGIGATVGKIDASLKLEFEHQAHVNQAGRRALGNIDFLPRRHAASAPPMLTSMPQRIFGEAGPEAFIPLANDARRPRALQLLRQTNKLLGAPLIDPEPTAAVMARGGIIDKFLLSASMPFSWEKMRFPPLGPGVGYEAMWRAVSGAFPGVRLHSGFRPGAITATGNRSYHGMGRAIDITPSMAIFNWIASHYGPSTRELIFSPAGGRQIHNGRSHFYSGVTRAQHWDHIHWAMANGGILDPRQRKAVRELLAHLAHSGVGDDLLFPGASKLLRSEAKELERLLERRILPPWFDIGDRGTRRMVRSGLIHLLHGRGRLVRVRQRPTGRVLPHGVRFRGLRKAIRETRRHIMRGGRFYDDLSFRGMSDNLRAHTDLIGSLFRQQHPDFDFNAPGARRYIVQALEDLAKNRHPTVRVNRRGEGPGNGPQTNQIIVNVAGSIKSDKDLVKLIRKEIRNAGGLKMLGR